MEKRRLQEEIESLKRENLRLNQRLERIKIEDKLTGLYKRGFFEELLEKEVARAKRYGKVFSLIMAELKDLKKEGEIKQVSSLLKRGLFRDIDVAARFSNRCFVFILPETSNPRALIVGQRIKKRIEEALKGSKVNIGIATYPYGASSKEGLIRQARKNISKMEA